MISRTGFYCFSDQEGSRTMIDWKERIKLLKTVWKPFALLLFVAVPCSMLSELVFWPRHYVYLTTFFYAAGWLAGTLAFWLFWLGAEIEMKLRSIPKLCLAWRLSMAAYTIGLICMIPKDIYTHTIGGATFEQFQFWAFCELGFMIFGIIIMGCVLYINKRINTIQKSV